MENLNRTRGLVFSQQFLLALAKKGIERQKAYVMVQRNAMKVWQKERDFKELLLADAEIGRYLSPGEIEAVFDLGYHLKHVDEIFERVFGD
jgi:adenylosuccinate lyase